MFYVTVYVKAVGGEVPATSSLAPKIGPLGLVSEMTIIMFLHQITIF
jgi:ribosomal protein L11